MQPTLQGHLVRLEPLTLAHLPALETIAFDPNIWRYFVAEPKTPEDLRKWAESALKLEAAGTGMPWVTISQAENKPAGGTRFIDLDRHHRTVEIGNTWLAPAYQRTGLNIEAKLLQLTYAFEELQLNRVAFKTHHENLQSQKAIAALGAHFEGVFRNHYVMPDGSLRHSHWFSITKEEWPKVKTTLEARLERQLSRQRDYTVDELIDRVYEYRSRSGPRIFTARLVCFAIVHQFIESLTNSGLTVAWASRRIKPYPEPLQRQPKTHRYKLINNEHTEKLVEKLLFGNVQIIASAQSNPEDMCKNADSLELRFLQTGRGLDFLIHQIQGSAYIFLNSNLSPAANRLIEQIWKLKSSDPLRPEPRKCKNAISRGWLPQE